MKYIDEHILMVLFVEVKEMKISFTSILYPQFTHMIFII